MFDEKHELLDYWYCNDAQWRHEYFDGFMEKLGVKVLTNLPKVLEKKLKKKLKEEAYG